MKEQCISYLLVYRSFINAKVKLDFPTSMQISSTQKILKKMRRFGLLLNVFYIIILFCYCLVTLLKLLYLYKKFKFEIIHSQDVTFGGLVSAVSSKILKSVFILHAHGVHQWTIAQLFPKKGFFYHFWLLIEKIVAKKADLIICVTPAAIPFYLNYGINSNKIRVIPTGVDTRYFKLPSNVRKETRDEIGVSDDEIIMLYLGRISPEKNVNSLVKAFGELVNERKIPKVKLLIVGPKAPESPILAELIRTYNICEKVTILDARYDVNRLYAASDIFILPSFSEGSPMVLLEAMASGKAIIASNISSIKEIIKNGEEAILVNPYDLNQLKEAILELCYNSNLRKKLGENAKKKAKQYDVNVVFPQIVEVYQEVLRNKVLNKNIVHAA